MIDNKSISLIVPCKNEANIIEAFIRRVPKYVDEIIIVDNNSTDRTARIARHAGARVVRETRAIGGIGYGFAHQKGLALATGDYVVAMDGDDTYPVQSIRTIVRYMQKYHLDVVFCNRLPLQNQKAISWVRKFGIFLLNTEFRLLYGKRMEDLLTGMWVGKKTSLQEVGAAEGDWNYSLEIKLKTLSHPSLHSSEYHIRHFERKHALSKQNLVKTGVHHAWFLLSKKIHMTLKTITLARHMRKWVIQNLAYRAS